jgi:hypothetical protein
MRIDSLLALLCLCTVAAAQPTPEPKDGKLAIPLTLSPAPLPKPLSRFYLTPQYKEMQPGNRVPTYMKAYMEQAAFFSKESVEQREKWNALPLSELPLAEMKKSPMANLGGLAYREGDSIVVNERGLIDFAPTGRPLSDVDEASRLLTSDWQIWFNIRRDGIGTLLPEVQKMRELANVLKVRMRYEIATKDFEKAAYSARTCYGLAQSFETHPTLIASLVGLAIESICLNALEEMIGQPGCPNLYWSFTEIPAEGLSLRTAIQGEKLLCTTLFGSLLTARGEIPDAELKKTLVQIDIFMALNREGGKAPTKSSEIFKAWAQDEKRVQRARAFLIETGSRPDAVKKYSALQAIITADARQYEVDLDETSRVFDLPNPEGQKLAKEFETARTENGAGILSAAILPNSMKVRQAHVRLQQRVAYLRVIEAVRLYAQDNAGKLPAQLADIKLPIPLDPVTLKAFEYGVKDGKATLTGGNPNPGQANTNRVYGIAIRK